MVVHNTSSGDSPALVIESISDTVQGDLTDAANVDTSDCGATLASGASCTITYSFNVPDNASDPFLNTVTVESHPDGFTNDISATDSDSVDLFQPSVTIDKSGTELSKEGDAITYNFTITNTSSAGSPNLVLDSVTDVGDGWAGLGDLTANATAVGCGNLAPGASCTFSVTIVAPAGPDPLENTVTALYHPDGFLNDITDSDDHSVNLFQPSIDVTKTCAPSQVKVGEPITFTCTITNTSTTDSPDLILVSVTDVRDPGGVSTDLTATAAAAGCDVLTSNPSETCSFSYTFTPSATGTVTNTVTAHFHPDGFTNDITDEGSCSVDVVGGCAHTPGFWKTHPETWDSLGNYTTAFGGTGTTVGEAGFPAFITTTPFPYTSGSFVGKTYLDILLAPVAGDRSVALAQMYIVNKLNAAYFGVPANIADTLKEVEDFFDSDFVDNTDSNLTDIWAVPVGSNPSGAAQTEANRLQKILADYITAIGDTGCPTLPGA